MDDSFFSSVDARRVEVSDDAGCEVGRGGEGEARGGCRQEGQDGNSPSGAFTSECTTKLSIPPNFPVTITKDMDTAPWYVSKDPFGLASRMTCFVVAFRERWPLWASSSSETTTPKTYHPPRVSEGTVSYCKFLSLLLSMVRLPVVASMVSVSCWTVSSRCSGGTPRRARRRSRLPGAGRVVATDALTDEAMFAVDVEGLVEGVAATEPGDEHRVPVEEEESSLESRVTSTVSQ